MPTSVRRLLVGAALLLAAYCSLPASSVVGCPFCNMQGQTLIQDVSQASMVLFGTFANAKLDGDGELGGSTDLQIEAVIKSNEILGDRKIITLPRYIPPVGDQKTKQKWLVFCDVFKGKLDPYRGVPIQADADMVKYLKGALAAKDKPVGQRLKFYFDYLDNPEPEISTDAYKEFANADYKDYREMAHDLSADRIAKWLQDPNTPAFRYGLYASMLGHCGKDKHAAILHAMLQDKEKRAASGVDGILAGYTMLKPKEGWADLQAIMRDPNQEFMLRYAALRTVRFFWDYRSDIIQKKDLAKGVEELLDQSDIADLAIEDLRKWNRWECAAKVLELQNRKSHDIPIIRRSILRYALSCPESTAVKFVVEYRKRDSEAVKDAEELLKLEPSKNP